jgi:hypothetical protein
MEHIYITVEGKPGADIKDICYDICVLSRKLGIGVDCKCNGITVMARPDSDPIRLYEAWEATLKTKRTCATD